MRKRGCSHEKHLLRQKIKVQKNAIVFKNAVLITFSPSLWNLTKKPSLRLHFKHFKNMVIMKFLSTEFSVPIYLYPNRSMEQNNETSGGRFYFAWIFRPAPIGGHPFCSSFDILSSYPLGQHSHHPGLLSGPQTPHTYVFLPHKSLFSWPLLHYQHCSPAVVELEGTNQDYHTNWLCRTTLCVTLIGLHWVCSPYNHGIWPLCSCLQTSQLLYYHAPIILQSFSRNSMAKWSRKYSYPRNYHPSAPSMWTSPTAPLLVWSACHDQASMCWHPCKWSPALCGHISAPPSSYGIDIGLLWVHCASSDETEVSPSMAQNCWDLWFPSDSGVPLLWDQLSHIHSTKEILWS